MEDKSDASFPALLQCHILNIFLGGAMMPLRQVRIAIRILWRRFYFDPIHTAFAFQPAKKYVRIQIP